MRALLRALFTHRTYHHRSAGPVVINPEAKVIIHVIGSAKKGNS